MNKYSRERFALVCIETGKIRGKFRYINAAMSFKSKYEKIYLEKLKIIKIKK